MLDPDGIVDEALAQSLTVRVGTEWEEPIPLPGGVSTAPFCTDVLGDACAAFVEAVAIETATPVDLAAVGALGACSTLIAGAVVVKADAGWDQSVNLYLNALAAPGEGKTPALTRVTAVLDSIEQDRRERFMPDIVEAETRKRVAEGRRKDAEARASKAGLADQLEAEQEALAAARAAAEIAVPAAPRLYTREATPEGLARLLSEQSGRLGVVTDEGVEFFELASRYAAMGKGNLGIYLQGWDGGRYVSDRAGREALVINHATLTVCLFAQPIVLADLGGDKQATGRGLLDRFLWSLPESLVGYRQVTRQPIPEELLQGWARQMTNLAQEAEEARDEPYELRLTEGARATFKAWQEHHEPRLRSGTGDLHAIVGWGSKLPGQVLRLAGNLHALRLGTLRGTITEDTIEAALTLADYFTHHALAAFGVMRSDDGTKDAQAVRRWLEDHGLAEVTTREIYTSKDWEKDRTRQALELLADWGWVRKIEPIKTKDEKKPPGRPAERWDVHPKMRSRTEQNGSMPEVVRRFVPESVRTAPEGAPFDWEQIPDYAANGDESRGNGSRNERPNHKSDRR